MIRQRRSASPGDRTVAGAVSGISSRSSMDLRSMEMLLVIVLVFLGCVVQFCAGTIFSLLLASLCEYFRAIRFTLFDQRLGAHGFKM